MAVSLAHRMALENHNIRADMVEVTEFPQLVQRYRIRGVPKIVINDRLSFEGAVPERTFLEQVMKALVT